MSNSCAASFRVNRYDRMASVFAECDAGFDLSAARSGFPLILAVAVIAVGLICITM